MGGQLHKIETKETRQKMLKQFQKLIDKIMYYRLSSTVSPADANVNDFLYRNLCWSRTASEI